MDKLNRYRQIVQDILTAHSQIKPAYGEIEMGTLFDFVNDRFRCLQYVVFDLLFRVQRLLTEFRRHFPYHFPH